MMVANTTEEEKSKAKHFNSVQLSEMLDDFYIKNMECPDKVIYLTLNFPEMTLNFNNI